MRRLSIASMICILAFLGTTYLSTSARWSGHFTLRIKLDVPSDIDRDSFLYHECWNDGIAQWLCEYASESDEGFEPAFRSTRDSDYVSISSGGTTSAFGVCDTYHHPGFLVLQFRRTTGDDGSRRLRVVIPIPRGRGDRETTLDLTQADVEQ
ncbi:hypothetical protein [Allorhodopirellula heiligendammensis]|uniref:Uncharacterized protein n=1 Tax=Allorhodopirellula heiligendammensis TaxID=2714739 RepID=A0A5C6BUI5_9BACT|nr:hypothetical protein [Allorhodopirellula heiligendammensis]TWU15708.1 hypothetical protein Poly21_29050 [Allorhodopirellula heiligendammensis]